MKNNLFIISFLFIIAILSCSKNKNVFLNDDFVENIRTKNYTKENYVEGVKFNNLGIYYYKQKNDIEAVKNYEYALQNYPTAEIYYNYANSLSNISKIDDSIRAYEISFLLNYPRKDLLFYNLACAYSRKSETIKTYEYLEKAISNGYFNTNNFLNDSDLSYIRKQTDWNDKFNKLVSIKNELVSKINIQNLSGKYQVHSAGDSSDIIGLCPNQRYFYIGNSCGPITITTGTWNLASNQLISLIEKQYIYDCVVEEKESFCCEKVKLKEIKNMTNNSQVVFTSSDMLLILKNGIKPKDHLNGVHSQITKTNEKFKENECTSNYKFSQ